jgi:hypothetical protein
MSENTATGTAAPISTQLEFAFPYPPEIPGKRKPARRKRRGLTFPVNQAADTANSQECDK